MQAWSAGCHPCRRKTSETVSNLKCVRVCLMLTVASCDMFFFTFKCINEFYQILGFGWFGQVPLAVEHVSIQLRVEETWNDWSMRWQLPFAPGLERQGRTILAYCLLSQLVVGSKFFTARECTREREREFVSILALTDTRAAVNVNLLQTMNEACLA